MFVAEDLVEIELKQPTGSKLQQRPREICTEISIRIGIFFAECVKETIHRRC